MTVYIFTLFYSVYICNFPIYHGYSVLVQDYYFLVVYCIRTQFLYFFLIVHYQLETTFFIGYILAFKRKKCDIHNEL